MWWSEDVEEAKGAESALEAPGAPVDEELTVEETPETAPEAAEITIQE